MGTESDKVNDTDVIAVGYLATAKKEAVEFLEKLNQIKGGMEILAATTKKMAAENPLNSTGDVAKQKEYFVTAKAQESAVIALNKQRQDALKQIEKIQQRQFIESNRQLKETSKNLEKERQTRAKLYSDGAIQAAKMNNDLKKSSKEATNQLVSDYKKQASAAEKTRIETLRAANQQASAVAALNKQRQAAFRDLEKESVLQKIANSEFKQAEIKLKGMAIALKDAHIAGTQMSPVNVKLQRDFDNLKSKVDAAKITVRDFSGNVGNYTESINRSTIGNSKFVKGLSSVWEVTRKLAYILPGLGIAGIFNLAYEGIVAATTALFDFGFNQEKVIGKLREQEKATRDLIEAEKDLNNESLRNQQKNIENEIDRINAIEKHIKDFGTAASKQVSLDAMKTMEDEALKSKTPLLGTETESRLKTVRATPEYRQLQQNLKDIDTINEKKKEGEGALEKWKDEQRTKSNVKRQDELKNEYEFEKAEFFKLQATKITAQEAYIKKIGGESKAEYIERIKPTIDTMLRGGSSSKDVMSFVETGYQDQLKKLQSGNQFKNQLTDEYKNLKEAESNQLKQEAKYLKAKNEYEQSGTKLTVDIYNQKKTEGGKGKAEAKTQQEYDDKRFQEELRKQKEISDSFFKTELEKAEIEHKNNQTVIDVKALNGRDLVIRIEKNKEKLSLLEKEIQQAIAENKSATELAKLTKEKQKIEETMRTEQVPLTPQQLKDLQDEENKQYEAKKYLIEQSQLADKENREQDIANRNKEAGNESFLVDKTKNKTGTKQAMKAINTVIAERAANEAFKTEAKTATEADLGKTDVLTGKTVDTLGEKFREYTHTVEGQGALLKKAEKEILDNENAFYNKWVETIADAVQKGADALKQGLHTRADLSIKANEQELSAIDRNNRLQQDLFARGKANTLGQSEAQAEKKQEEIRQRQIKQAKVDEGIEFAKLLITETKEIMKRDNVPMMQAATIALGETLAMKGLVRSISGAYATGVENLQGPGTETSDSIVARLSKGESVATARATKDNPGLVTAMNLGKVDEWMMQNFNSQNVVSEATPKQSQEYLVNLKVLNEIKSLNETLEKRPVTVARNMNEEKEWIEEIVKGQIKYITRYGDSRP